MNPIVVESTSQPLAPDKLCKRKEKEKKKRHRKNVNKSKSLNLFRDMYNASAHWPVMRLPFHIIDPPDTGYQIQGQVSVKRFYSAIFPFEKYGGIDLGCFFFVEFRFSILVFVFFCGV